MPKSDSSKKGSPKKESPKKGSPKKGSPKKGSPKKKDDKKSKKDKSPKSLDVSESFMRNAPITHVIFDLDGVLLNSVRCIELFINKLCQPYENYLTLSIKRRLKNRKLESVAKMLVKELRLPMTRREFINYYNANTVELLRSVELLPGVSQIIEYFRKHKMPMGVVTESTEEHYKYKISRHKLIFDKISFAVCYESDPEASLGKPAPFIYEIAASRFKDNIPSGPYNILVFEDTADGVDAALAARMKVVWIADSVVDASLHNFHQNLMVIDNLEKFKPEEWRLPYRSGLYSI